MNIPFYNISHQSESNGLNIQKAIDRVMDRKMFAASTEVEAFESEFAAYCGAQHFLACANGTDAIELILRALEIGPGDQVLVPAFSCWATVEPVILLGATPIFVDISAENFGMDPDLVQSAITPRTKAIIAVNLFGFSSDLTSLSRIANQNGLFLIEDCAQSHGVKYRDSMTGNYGVASAFSFYPTKNLGAIGEAGGVLTSNENLAEKVRILRDHGQASKNDHKLAGRNSRMDEIQAAVLREKLQYLDNWNHQRRENARMYFNILHGLVALPEFSEDATFHQMVILVKQRDALKEFLKGSGVETSIHYPYTLPDLAGQSPHSFPEANLVCSQILSIPVWPGLSSKEIEYVCGCIISFTS